MTEQTTVRPCDQSGLVEKQAYFKPEYVALEKQRLWPRVWQVACPTPRRSQRVPFDADFRDRPTS